MMLLTLVENAIKHGLAPQRDGGRVDIGARALQAKSLELEVADTNRRFGGDTSGGGTGLANIQVRLAANVRQRGATEPGRAQGRTASWPRSGCLPALTA